MQYIILFSNGRFNTVSTLKEVEAIVLEDPTLVTEIYKGELVTFKRVEKVNFGKAAA